MADRFTDFRDENLYRSRTSQAQQAFSTVDQVLGIPAGTRPRYEDLGPETPSHSQEQPCRRRRQPLQPLTNWDSEEEMSSDTDGSEVSDLPQLDGASTISDDYDSTISNSDCENENQGPDELLWWPDENYDEDFLLYDDYEEVLSDSSTDLEAEMDGLPRSGSVEQSPDESWRDLAKAGIHGHPVWKRKRNSVVEKGGKRGEDKENEPPAQRRRV